MMHRARQMYEKKDRGVRRFLTRIYPVFFPLISFCFFSLLLHHVFIQLETKINNKETVRSTLRTSVRSWRKKPASETRKHRPVLADVCISCPILIFSFLSRTMHHARSPEDFFKSDFRFILRISLVLLPDLMHVRHQDSPEGGRFCSGCAGRVFILNSSFDFQMRFILKPICSTAQRCLFSSKTSALCL